MDRVKPKRVLVHVYHTASEMDVLLPIFLEIRKSRPVDVTVMFTEKFVLRKFLEDEVSRECARRLGIRLLPLVRFQWSEQAPERGRPVRRFLYRVTKFLEQLFYLPRMVFLAATHDVYMHEMTRFSHKTYLFYLFKRLFPSKRIFAYPHATALNYFHHYKKKVFDPENVTLLVFDEKSGSNYRNLGYENQYVMGFPKFFGAWTEYLRGIDGGSGKEPCVVIYSRGIHPISMDAANYRYLYESAYRAIREKFGNVPILVKLHPREDRAVFEEIRRANRMENVELATVHPGVLARNALVTVSYYTSAILDALAVGVPSVDYYVESRRFREIETMGSIYKLVGIDSVDDEAGLAAFFDRVIAGKYEPPAIMGAGGAFRHVDVDFL